MEFLTTRQAALLLGFVHGTLDAWRCERKGPPYLRLMHVHGGPVRYPIDALETWVREKWKPTRMRDPRHDEEIKRIVLADIEALRAGTKFRLARQMVHR